MINHQMNQRKTIDYNKDYHTEKPRPNSVILEQEKAKSTIDQRDNYKFDSQRIQSLISQSVSQLTKKSEI